MFSGRAGYRLCLDKGCLKNPLAFAEAGYTIKPPCPRQKDGQRRGGAVVEP